MYDVGGIHLILDSRGTTLLIGTYSLVHCFRLELFVDDEQVGTSRLPSGDSRINTMPGQEGGLYIGGVPRGVGAEGSAATLEPFRGCISDVIITERYLLRMSFLKM